MKPLPKQYEHKEREKYWQQYWTNSDVYHFRDDMPRDKTFVIDTPPPTVSGLLHMGHIFSYTQADFIARYQRMCGKDVFYPLGFDDNGLPTERLVEKIKEKKAAQYESREQFIEVCREVVRDAEEEFRKLFKSAALSVDWRQEYQTISAESRQLSQASFIDLLQKDQAYRDFRPTYWDWVDQTAIAQAEIENKELPGTMNELEFNLEDGTPITIMTTRPELLGACVAVMYHPEDPNAERYKEKYAITPLFGIKAPMIADELVEREKGTGLVMCCTFGDDTDKEWWRKYALPLRALLGKDGRLNFDGELYRASFKDQDKPSSSELQGLKLKQANVKILELLQTSGKLLKQTSMVHTVKCAERSGTPIEIIPTYQWFVRVTDKKEALMDKGAQCHWYPDYMRVRLNQWIEGLKEDWCISRQRFFGVPFPVWYSKRVGEEGKIIVADMASLPVDPLVDTPKGYTKDEVIPDIDVMDTWATSSISPQLNSKGISKAFTLNNQRHAKLFPADIRPQAHEIIRTWAFYTIVKAHLHQNCIPWKNLMISGWCLAADKTKMSKSKGNVVTPVALIEDKGTDAVRYWASTSRLGADTAFSEDLLKIGRKLVNKIWNASNFAAINLEKLKDTPSTASKDTLKGYISEPLDLWILSRLHQCIKKATAEFEHFEYCDARVAIENFFWNDFCDNYLELVKARSYGESPGNQQSALYTLYHCLHAILRLFAPFTPHIAEEIYSHLFDEEYARHGSIHTRGLWPKEEDFPYDIKAELIGSGAVDILNVIRKAKSEASVSIKHPVEKVSLYSKATAPAPNWRDIEYVIADLKAAGNVQQFIESKTDALPYNSENGWFAIEITLASLEEHKRNAEQSRHEKLEGEPLYGPGKPDMSKHAVKTKVDSLPHMLGRQK